MPSKTVNGDYAASIQWHRSKVCGEGGLTRPHDFGGRDSRGGGKDHFALLQSSDICYHVSTWGVNVEYFTEGSGLLWLS
jgi:hypothetical protein